VTASRNIQKDVLRFLAANPGRLPGKNWIRHLEVSGISYSGQEVALARPITLAQIQPALPKKGVCGSLSALDFAETDVRDALPDPSLSIKGSDEWGDAAFTARCHNAPEAILVEFLDRGAHP
jgi:hypothetical protein